MAGETRGAARARCSEGARGSEATAHRTCRALRGVLHRGGWVGNTVGRTPQGRAGHHAPRQSQEGLLRVHTDIFVLPTCLCWAGGSWAMRLFSAISYPVRDSRRPVDASCVVLSIRISV